MRNTLRSPAMASCVELTLSRLFSERVRSGNTSGLWACVLVRASVLAIAPAPLPPRDPALSLLGA